MKSSELLAVSQPDFAGWILDVLHIGLLVVDEATRVLAVNRWFEQRAGLDAATLCNRALFDIFPELRGGRLERALDDAIRSGCAGVLSQSLNRCPFPLFSPSLKPRETTPVRIEQRIQILPRVSGGGETRVVIQIEDVSAAVRREFLLRQQAAQLHQLAYIDGLTGVANRRRFSEVLAAERLRARRTHRPLSLILFDVDQFKEYNDRNGHQAGDRCLTCVAHATQALLKRPADLIARYGGEEFAVILPETDPAGAMMLAEAMRREVEALVVAYGEDRQARKVTISLGVSSDDSQTDLTAEALVALADRALYRSKNGGRNCCTLLLAAAADDTHA